MLSFTLFSILIISFFNLWKCDDNLIAYELVQATKNYKYEKYQLKKDVVTSLENGFSITINDEDIPVLRKGMLQITPDTYYFWMDNCNLVEIEPGVFDNQNITVEIRLEMNKLKTIKSGTFKGLRIEKLDLSYNLIEVVEENAIVDLKNLWELHLSRNKISELSPNAFVNTPSLVVFDIVDNKLKTLSNNLFNFMSKNKEVGIALSKNRIENIDPEVFNGIVVWNLALANNNLKEISGNLFKKNAFRLLYLENNKLETLPDEFFLQKNLTDFDLKGNNLKCDVVQKLERFSDGLPSGANRRDGISKVRFDKNNC